jgi:hypothetical protein
VRVRDQRRREYVSARVWLLSLSLCLGGCFQMTGGVWVTPSDPPDIDPPVPSPFEGTGPPALVATEKPGLMAAPSLDPTVYYYQPDERWYRWAFNRWYEAFAWDGNWFPPEEVPEALTDRHPQPYP